jgi:hypothetical protein
MRCWRRCGTRWMTGRVRADHCCPARPVRRFPLLLQRNADRLKGAVVVLSSWRPLGRDNGKKRSAPFLHCFNAAACAGRDDDGAPSTRLNLRAVCCSKNHSISPAACASRHEQKAFAVWSEMPETCRPEPLPLASANGSRSGFLFSRASSPVGVQTRTGSALKPLPLASANGSRSGFLLSRASSPVRVFRR